MKSTTTDTGKRQRRTARFHVECDLNPQQDCLLDTKASHHLSKVLRGRPGDVLELFNGDGYNYRAQLLEVGKQCTVTVHDKCANPSESPLHTTLIQAVSRGDRMDTSIQKCVELGVHEIQPVYTRHSVSALDARRATRKQAHWQAIAIGAAEQSGRSVVPMVSEICSLEDYLNNAGCPSGTGPSDTDLSGTGLGNTLSVLLSPLASVALRAAHNAQPARARVLIGPESGLDSDEVAMAERAGFIACRLGPRVLRTETAGPTALTLLQAWHGDLF